MAAVFLKLFNMSIAAGWVVLAVLVLRLFFRKIPKWIPCMLWGLVGIRLICPFAVESIFSLLPSAETVPQDIMHTAEPAIHSGVSFLNSYVNPILSEKLAPTPEVSVRPMQNVVWIASVIWLGGVMIMACYGMISYLRLYRTVGEGTPIYAKAQGECCTASDIWLCDYISAPFILGVFRPRTFLPSTIRESDMEYVIAHEQAHLKRRDHWWKPVGFVLLTIYWFHPLMWIAYIALQGY